MPFVRKLKDVLQNRFVFLQDRMEAYLNNKLRLGTIVMKFPVTDSNRLICKGTSTI